MTPAGEDHDLMWEHAAGMSAAEGPLGVPQGALVPDARFAHDQVAVVFDGDNGPPVITVEEKRGVQTIFANGVPVAVVASAKPRNLRPEDVLLVERFT